MGRADSSSSAAALQSFLQTALCTDIQSCNGQHWALLHLLTGDLKTAKIQFKPLFWAGILNRINHNYFLIA